MRMTIALPLVLLAAGCGEPPIAASEPFAPDDSGTLEDAGRAPSAHVIREDIVGAIASKDAAQEHAGDADTSPSSGTDAAPALLDAAADATDASMETSDAGTDAGLVPADAGYDSGPPAPPRTSCDFDSPDADADGVPDDCEICPATGCLPIALIYVDDGTDQTWAPLEGATAYARVHRSGSGGLDPQLELEAPEDAWPATRVAFFDDPTFVGHLRDDSDILIWFGVSLRTIGSTSFNGGQGAFEAPPPPGRAEYYLRAIIAPDGVLSREYTQNDARLARVIWTVHASLE